VSDLSHVSGPLIFEINHFLAILPGMVAALFLHPYGSPMGIVADCRKSE
jgi:hypothetical protein